MVKLVIVTFHFELTKSAEVDGVIEALANGVTASEIKSRSSDRDEFSGRHSVAVYFNHTRSVDLQVMSKNITAVVLKRVEIPVVVNSGPK